MENKKWKKYLFHSSKILAFLYPSIALGIGTYLLIKHPMIKGVNIYIIGGLSLLLILALGSLTYFHKKKSKKGQIVSIIMSILLGFIITGCDVLYYDVIQTMGNMTTETGDLITSKLYVLKDSKVNSLSDLQEKNIAVQPTTSISMYTLLVEAIEASEFNINNFTLSQYTNYVKSYEELLAQTVDAVVLDETAISIIKEVYPEFDTDVKIVETFSKRVEMEEIKKIDVSKEPFTMLISGIDSRSDDLNEISRSDVIMIAAFNPKTLKLQLTSIPRDTYMYVTCQGYSDKITHSGNGGIQCTETSLEDTFGIDIDYYIKVNWTAVVDIVDTLGGIEVDVPISFTESNSHDIPNTVVVEKGLQTLDGEQALALCRHRNTLYRGDIDRGLHQQLVIQGLLKKVASMSSVMNVDKLLGVFGTNIQTNMPVEQMYGLFSLLTDLATNSKFGDLSALSIQTHTIDGEGNMHTPSYYSEDLYFYMPYQYSIENTTRNINRILEIDKYPLPTNTFAFNANIAYDNIHEDAISHMDNDEGSTSYAIPDYIDYGFDAPSMPNLIGQTMDQINAWATSLKLEDGYSLLPYFIYEDGSPVIDSIGTCIGTSISAGTVLEADFLDNNGGGVTITMSRPIVEEPTPAPEPEVTPTPDPSPEISDTPESIPESTTEATE